MDMTEQLSLSLFSWATYCYEGKVQSQSPYCTLQSPRLSRRCHNPSLLCFGHTGLLFIPYIYKMYLPASGLYTCFTYSKHNVTSSPKEKFLLFRHDDGVVIFVVGG